MNYSSDLVDITIKDCTGRKLEKLRAVGSNTEQLRQVFQLILDKFSSNLKIVRKLPLEEGEPQEELSFY